MLEQIGEYCIEWMNTVSTVCAFYQPAKQKCVPTTRKITNTNYAYYDIDIIVCPAIGERKE